jgi:hypothetical protein
MLICVTSAARYFAAMPLTLVPLSKWCHMRSLPIRLHTVPDSERASTVLGLPHFCPADTATRGALSRGIDAGKGRSERLVSEIGGFSE